MILKLIPAAGLLLAAAVAQSGRAGLAPGPIQSPGQHPTHDLTRPAPPEFNAPPAVAPVIEGGVFTRFYHQDDSLAREGYLVDGVRAGVWKAWKLDGQREEHGGYENYHRVGPWILYGSGARSRSEGLYDNRGLRHGTWATYGASGSLRVVADYDHGTRHGRLERFTKDGRLLSRLGYKHGRKHGPYILFTRGAKTISDEGAWVDGKRDGAWKHYHSGGELERSGSYAEGRQTGEWLEYYPNGQRKNVGSFVDGRPSGEWRGFYKQGERRFVGSFVDGTLDGPYLEWYPSGDKKGEGTYAKGLFDGPWSFWERDGRVDETKTGVYRDGDLVR